MAVESHLPRNAYVANGVQTSFPYTFEVDVASEVIVYVGGIRKTLTTDYTVTNVDNDDGGNVVFVSPPAEDATVVFVRKTSDDRLSDFQQQGAFRADTVNREMDRLTKRDQETNARIDRKLGIADSDPDATIDPLPVAAERANKFMWFDGNGRPSAVSVVTTGAAILTSFWESVVTTVNAAAARTALGLEIGTDVLAPDGDGTGLIGIMKQGKHSIWVPASAMQRLTTGTACGTLQTYGTQYGQYDGLSFADGSIQQACFWIAMPKSWNPASAFDLIPFWSVDGAQTGDVAWRFRLNARGDTANIGTAYDATTSLVYDSAGGVQGKLLVSPNANTGALPGAAESNMVFVVVERIGNDSGDTLSAAAILRGVKMLYATNKSRDN